jgi:2-oxo-3-hexenedioate decarboxylase
MNVDSPLCGFVTSGMLASYGEPIPPANLIHPRVEPEIAFLLGEDVPAPATVTSVLAATEAVFAAVDVLDARYEDFRFRLPDVVADNASAGLFVMGPQAVPPADLPDLRLLGCVLRVNGDGFAVSQNIGTMITAFLPLLYGAITTAELNLPLIVGSFTFGCAIIAAIAAWPAPETYRIHLNDLGKPDAVPVPIEEYERIRASA